MKKLGLIGGTGPESTIEYYREIVYGVQKKTGEAFFPNLTIESLSVFDVLRFCDHQDYRGLTEYLLRGIQCLSDSGAEYAALTGITPHVVFEELSADSPIPLVSMVETSCSYAAENGFRKVGLLGTGPTMRGTFFQKAFADRGIETVTPCDEDLQFIAARIETELEFGKIVPETQKEFCRIVNRMADEDGIQAVVLGCTELPMIFRGTELPVPGIDVMRVHIDALIDLITDGTPVGVQA